MQIKILVVDDEGSICEILKINLESEGYSVTVANSVDEALNYDLPSYSLFILDVMMDKISGFDFAKRLKNNSRTENIPILFCSALNGEDERIMGLNIGADDYIVKPFMIRELLARVRSILRRSGMTQKLISNISNGSYIPDIIYDGLRIDRNVHIVYLDGVDIGLTKTEYELLLFMINNANNVHSRQVLMEKVWQKNRPTPRTVDTTVTRLRKKLGSLGNNIITRLGYGYGFKKNI